MFSDFQQHLTTSFPYLKSAKILVAVSGGLDSVVLAHFCHKMKFDFAIAHCNFNLRGKESDADEAFVLDLAEKLDIEAFVEYFDTEAFAADHQVSIQMAARELRYNWFLDLKNSLGFEYILTAHHANDNVETFLINFIRGTGLDGLTGIPHENNSVLRPLLPFSREQLKSFAEENGIAWREDSSNASTKYQRNKIRHQIIPLMQEINPQLLSSFNQTQKHLAQSAALLEDYTAMLFKEIVSKRGESYFFKIEKIQAAPNKEAVLYQLLKGFGFTAWDDINDLLTAQPGKYVLSGSHRLVKDREHLILTVLGDEDENEKDFYLSEDFLSGIFPFGKINFQRVEKIEETAENIAYVDKEKLKFPLKLRKWEAGDSFYPIGMKGTKKLSDFFANKKLSLPEKENVWMLFSEEKIVWVINHRSDERFKVENATHNILKITCTP